MRSKRKCSIFDLLWPDPSILEGESEKFVFLENKNIWGKKYTAFLVLIGATCVQKLRQFEFLTPAIKISFLFDFCTDVLLKYSYEEGEFLSTTFLRPKKDGTHQIILNLKKVNKFVAYHHFKIESLKDVISMIRPDCFTVFVDLKDTYYSVSMPQDHQEYLKLKPWNLKMVSCFMLLFHFLRNVRDYGLEVNICMFVVLVELSDFDA